MSPKMTGRELKAVSRNMTRDEFVKFAEEQGIPLWTAKMIHSHAFRTDFDILPDGSIEEPNGIIRRPTDSSGHIVLPKGSRLLSRVICWADGESFVTGNLIETPDGGPCFGIDEQGGLLEMTALGLETHRSRGFIKTFPVKKYWEDESGVRHMLDEDGILPEGTKIVSGRLILPGEKAAKLEATGEMVHKKLQHAAQVGAAKHRARWPEFQEYVAAETRRLPGEKWSKIIKRAATRFGISEKTIGRRCKETWLRVKAEMEAEEKK